MASRKASSKITTKSAVEDLAPAALPAASASPVTAPEAAETAADAAEEATLREREAARKHRDKISQAHDRLADAEWVPSRSLTQVFGQAAIDFYKGDVDAMPHWRFARQYLGAEAVVIDTFRTSKAYDAAQVEERRRVVSALGGRYAALGPSHSRLPHADPELAKRFPSMVEQLGWA
jgi:hypothetical protein